MLIIEPVAVPAAARTDVRDYLRLDGPTDGAAIDAMIAAAIDVCDTFLGAVTIERDVRERIAAGPDWRRLAAAPVLAITELRAGDAALAVDTYAIDITADARGMVRIPNASGLVEVRYRCGLVPDWARLPAAIRHGIVRLAAHYHLYRDAAQPPEPPSAVGALWQPYRRMRLK